MISRINHRCIQSDHREGFDRRESQGNSNIFITDQLNED